MLEDEYAPFDRFVQRWRMRKAAPYVPDHARLLDIGAGKGALLAFLGDRLREGVGVEPGDGDVLSGSRFIVLRGLFPFAPDVKGPFDAITMLAVLEHIPRAHQPAVAERCFDLLKPGGVLIITVPSPSIDAVLWVLKRLRVARARSMDEHYGFSPGEVPRIFNRLELVVHRRFQAGLNHLFVFRKC